MDLVRTLSNAFGHFLHHPFFWLVFICVILFSVVSIVYGLLRDKYSYFLIAIIIPATLCIFLSIGSDTHHHVFRVAVLHEQIAQGYIGGFVVAGSHDSLPVFLYYSIIPYVIPVALTFVGLSSDLSYKISLVLYLYVFVVGCCRLITFAPISKQYGLILVVLLISCNYIIGSWLWRSAVSEIVALSLVPWIVVFLIERPRRSFLICALLALQMAAHPIVFIQCAIAELIGAWALSSFREVTKTSAAPILGALVVSSPFWAPQLYFWHAVLGNKALPISWPATFQTLTQLVDPRRMPTTGLCIIAAVIYAASTNKLRPKMFLVLLALAISLIIQMKCSQHLSDYVPILTIVQFIWRWMLVSCFVAFTALLIMPEANFSVMRVLGTLAVCNALFMCSTHIGISHLGQSFTNVYSPRSNDAIMQEYYANHIGVRDGGADLFGLAEYFPDLSSLPQDCSIKQNAVDFSAVENGIPVKKGAFITVSHPPFGFVRYEADAAPIGPPVACDDNLRFGPFPKTAIFGVNESLMKWIFISRYAVATCLAIFFLAVAVSGWRSGLRNTARS